MKRLFLHIFLLTGLFAFSRAGGGGGSHGGSGGHFSGGGHSYGYSHYGNSGEISPTERRIINTGFITAFVVLLSYTLYITFLYYFKPSINKRKLKASFKADSFWNHDEIMAYTRQFYLELQREWTKGDLLDLKERMSPRLYRHYMGMLNRNRRRRIRNIIENIEISKTSVIYFDDYADNSKDSIAILIQGQMKDYYSRSGVIPSADVKPFKDAYVFVRQNNQLILDEIINEPTFYQITKPKSYIETI